jgi:drug/metabolite transporter (DMT)-like permease
LLAAGYGLQTAGLERTTVSAAGFVTGMYVVLTPVFGLALFRIRPGRGVWLGVALAVTGLAMLSGVAAGSGTGDLLVLAAAALYALQIALMERFAPRYDPLAFTTAEMAAAFVGFAVIAVAAGQIELPRGATVWGALLVTGVFASALGYLAQAWAQRRTSATRTALIFALEPVFAGIFGYVLAGDRLGALGWAGCAVILGGIAVAEPAAAGTLARLVRRSV